MNKIFIAAALVATSFAAMAEGSTYDHPQPVTSTVSRAEVQAQTAPARARGEIGAGEFSYVAPPQGPALTRAEVLMALDEARRNHELVSGEMSYAAEGHATAVSRMASR